MGVPIPTIVDGKVKYDVFIEKPLVKTITWKFNLSDKKILSEAEMKKISELRNMFNTS